MSKKNLGLGIIGCGVISDWHAKSSREVQGVELIAVTDYNKEAGENFAKKYSCDVNDSAEDLLKRDDIDIVAICTPSGLHKDYCVQVANAGKHVIVEKPMAITNEGCREIIDACEKNKIKLSVISQMRFSPFVVKAKEALDQGKLGKIVSGDIYMKYYRSPEYYKSSAWRGTWKMDGGGALMNQGIHGVDILQYLLGPVKSIFGLTKTLIKDIEVEDTASSIIEYENGAIGVIQATTSVFPGYPRRIEINGTNGSIVLEENKIIVWDVEGSENVKETFTKTDERNSSSDPKNFGIEGHVKQYENIVDSILNGSKMLIDQYEGKKPVEIILGIYESSKTGKQVFLK